MTRNTALGLLAQYAEMSKHSPDLEILHGIRDRWPEDGSESKAMRWLGFAQGVLHAKGVFTLEQLKEHSRNGTIYCSS